MKRGERMRPVWKGDRHEVVSAISRGEPRRSAETVTALLRDDVIAYVGAGYSPVDLSAVEIDYVIAMVAEDRISDTGPGGVLLLRTDLHAYALTVRMRRLAAAVARAQGAGFDAAGDAAYAEAVAEIEELDVECADAVRLSRLHRVGARKAEELIAARLDDARTARDAVTRPETTTETRGNESEA